VKGHADHPRNEFADDLATTAAKEQTVSDGLVASSFEEWLEGQREKGKYLEFMEFTPPEE